jgi:hypothetical protein
LEHGADSNKNIDLEGSIYTWSPLHSATGKSDIDIDYGGDIYLEPKCSPLMFCQYNDQGSGTIAEEVEKYYWEINDIKEPDDNTG